MRTMNDTTPGYEGWSADDWKSLVVANSSQQSGAFSKPISKMTSAEIERMDQEAARQLGDKRRLTANGLTPAQVKAAQAALGRGWLRDDPRHWRGRKIRSRCSQGTYSIRQIFNNGRVEMEKGFMLYNSDVETIRKDFEPA
jgi:hypothetical protein